MLETTKERVELLKAGLTGKTIEELYIKYNNFKIVRSPMYLGLIELDTGDNNNPVASQETVAECV